MKTTGFLLILFGLLALGLIFNFYNTVLIVGSSHDVLWSSSYIFAKCVNSKDKRETVDSAYFIYNYHPTLSPLFGGSDLQKDVDIVKENYVRQLLTKMLIPDSGDIRSDLSKAIALYASQEIREADLRRGRR